MLLDGFDEWTVDKGRTYHARGAVRELVAGKHVLTALVKGTRPHPYMVTIPLDSGTGMPEPLEGNCTCPVGTSCKHMVAALLAFAGDRRKAPGPLPVGPPRAPPSPGGAAARAQTTRESVLAELGRLLDRSREPRATTVPAARIRRASLLRVGVGVPAAAPRRP